MFKRLLFFFLLHLPLFAWAQLGKGISIESNFHIGQILKHTPKLNFDVDHLSYGFEFNLRNKKYGKKAWHQALNYPVPGVAIFYYRIGESAIFGDAIGIFPNIAFPVIRGKKVDLRFYMGAGIAYLSTHFDPIDNPTNNAVGSNVNNIAAIKWQMTYRFKPTLRFNTGFSFTHFSNGASQLPNFGINILAYTVGFQYTPKPLVATDFIRHETIPAFKRWGFDLRFDLGFRENIVAGGPRYPVSIASLAGTYRTSLVNRLYLGLEYEFNKSVYVLGLHTFTLNSKSEARRRASRLALFFADELLFGNVGFYAQFSFYLPIDSWLLPFFMYTKAGLRYYFPPIGRPKTRFYAGIYLKSHKITAEHFSFGFGATF
ncbi:MAG: acyloxyacyl hydrolase [Bacteroidota bacterium]